MAKYSQQDGRYSPIAARLDPLSSRPACADKGPRCTGRAWWRLKVDGCLYVCSCCLVTREVAAGVRIDKYGRAVI